MSGRKGQIPKPDRRKNHLDSWVESAYPFVYLQHQVFTFFWGREIGSFQYNFANYFLSLSFRFLWCECLMPANCCFRSLCLWVLHLEWWVFSSFKRFSTRHLSMPFVSYFYDTAFKNNKYVLHCEKKHFICFVWWYACFSSVNR